MKSTINDGCAVEAKNRPSVRFVDFCESPETIFAGRVIYHHVSDCAHKVTQKMRKFQDSPNSF